MILISIVTLLLLQQPHNLIATYAPPDPSVTVSSQWDRWTPPSSWGPTSSKRSTEAKCPSRRTTSCSPVWPGSGARPRSRRPLRWDTRGETSPPLVWLSHLFLNLTVKATDLLNVCSQKQLLLKMKLCWIKVRVAVRLLLHNANSSCSARWKHATSPVTEWDVDLNKIEWNR